jgi:23S rRNA (cytosine1962-C5)-methyltransferase
MPKSSYPQLALKRGSERSLMNGHPWVYSGAIKGPQGDLPPVGVIDIVDHHGRFVLRGLYNRKAAIRVRALTQNPDEAIDGAFFRRALAQSVALRAQAGLAAQTDAMRLVHGESDGLPGLIVDDYAGYLVVQFHTAGMEHFRSQILDALWEHCQPLSIYERSDVGTRRTEGLRNRPTGLLRGAPAPEMIAIRENGVPLFVDLYHGQKTGLFLDQRDNRLLVQRLAKGKHVLNCFGYTAGFSAHALHGGAKRTVDVDSAASCIPAARRNLSASRGPGATWDYVVANAFGFLDDLSGRGPRFDVVVLDPPSMLRKQQQLEHAMGVYTKLNRNALRLVKDGGVVLTASCSARVGQEDFFQIVRRAAVGAGVRLRILATNLHPADHPVDPACPEARYLKSICARVLRG